MERYRDRREAGQILASLCLAYKQAKNSLVLGLPRGGVPVAYEVAKALSLPLDVFLVRKLGFPGAEETAMGALASGGITVFNEDILQQIPLSKPAIDAVIAKESKELERREQCYRQGKEPLKLANKTVILVDDGIATGATVTAAISAIRQQKPTKLILAVPVSAKDSAERLKPLVDAFICPLQPDYFYAVGFWYDVFNQTSDEEVIHYLNTAE